MYHLLVPNAAVFTEGQLGRKTSPALAAAANGDLERGTGGRDQGGSQAGQLDLPSKERVEVGSLSIIYTPVI